MQQLVGFCALQDYVRAMYGLKAAGILAICRLRFQAISRAIGGTVPSRPGAMEPFHFAEAEHREDACSNCACQLEKIF
jgi:hypothetical protein